MSARIKSISVSGIRTLENFTLDLDGLTVLIGENGSGKSTIVESFELLRRLTNPNFWNEFNQIHGGLAMLLRKGAGEISMGAEFADQTQTYDYQITLGRNGITSESFRGSIAGRLIERVGDTVKIPRLTNATSQFKIPTNQPAIGVHEHEFTEAIRTIDVQLPFVTAAYWSTQSQGGRPSSIRDSVTIAPTNQLERGGDNLANAFYTLRNEQSRSDWDNTMELVRLGLGQWVESVNLRPDAGGGKIAIWIKIANVDQQIPSASLSEGQLAYLAFVALARLPTERSVLVFDEIETHLHPKLLTRVMGLMRTIAERQPVLLTTHSRRVLDDIDEPARSVGVLELDEDSLHTKLRRLDEAKLTDWLKDYDGLGQVLDAGYPEALFQADEGR